MLLAAMYQSLARPVELSFKDGRTGYGLFTGLDHTTSNLLVSNFCFANSETSESSRKVALSELAWYVVRESPALHQGPTRAAKSSATSLATTPVREREGYSNGGSGQHVDKLPPKDPQRGIKNDVFRTDVEISKRTADAKPTDKKPPATKVFQRFAEPLNTAMPLVVLEKEGKMGDWNQFQANHEAFGIRSEFNENDYTTELDLKSVSKKSLQNADRLAQEIMASEKEAVAASRHRQEDRNEIELMDNDNEEALFSAVIREKPSAAEPEPKAQESQVPKPAFNLKKVPAEKAQPFRTSMAKAVAAQKIAAKEAPATAPSKANLVNQLSEPRPPVQDFYQPPVIKQPVYMPVGYPPQAMAYPQAPYGYYPQGIYYQSYPNQGAMYGGQGYFQQPK